MTKRWQVYGWILLSSWSGVLSSCRVESAPDPVKGITVLDDTAQPITLPRPTQRIASLSPEHTEVLFELGCGKQIVLRDQVSTFPLLAQKIPATNPFLLSPEHVAGFHPDLVLVSHADHSRINALKTLGINVALFSPRTINDLFRTIISLGQLCGATSRAIDLVGKLRHRVARITQAIKGRPRPQVYIETDGSDPQKPWVAGPGSLVDHLVQLAGGTNRIAQGRPFSQINAEEILRRGPDVVLLMGVQGDLQGKGLESLRQRPGWSALTAVAQGRVVDSIHADLLSRASPRIVDGLEALARALHPGAFQP